MEADGGIRPTLGIPAGRRRSKRQLFMHECAEVLLLSLRELALHFNPSVAQHEGHTGAQQ
jgi:hypothetical protein